MPLHEDDIKPWRFYWHPPKSYYNKGSLEFWELEYAFVFDLEKDEYLVVSSNAHEDVNEAQVDYLSVAMGTNYFFEIEQKSVKPKAYQQVMVAIFESELLD